MNSLLVIILRLKVIIIVNINFIIFDLILIKIEPYTVYTVCKCLQFKLLYTYYTYLPNRNVKTISYSMDIIILYGFEYINYPKICLLYRYNNLLIQIEKIKKLM